jgi:hypothetical protein
MKANNLTISIPGGCQKKCPYCVCNMTFRVKENLYLFRENILRVQAMAGRIGITHVLITGKGEPFENPKLLREVCSQFYHDYPIEIQTALRNFTEEQMGILAYTDVLAISIDHPDQLDDVGWWQELTSHNFIVRISVVLTNRFDGFKLHWYIEKCKELGIRQLTIRLPTVPKNRTDTPLSDKTARWIDDNTIPYIYEMILNEVDGYAEKGLITHIRDLQFGADVWDIDGIAFTSMKYCVESNNGQTIRSLIFQSDGHLYTTWDSPGSILW